MSKLIPAWTGGHHTSVMPGTPARSSTPQAVAARMIDEQIAFSEKLPGNDPSMQPRRIGSWRWVMAVAPILGFGGFSPPRKPVEFPKGPFLNYFPGAR